MASLKDTLAQLPIATVEVIRPATSPLPTLAAITLGLRLEQAGVTSTGTSDGVQYSCESCGNCYDGCACW